MRSLAVRRSQLIDTGYDMHWEDQSNLEKMLHASLQLLNDPELPVRVCAALALPETTRYSQGASRSV